LSDLAHIPNAARLESIIPQTMSVNLIVGILSAEQPRRVITRTGSPMDLVELLVGDDTRAGFRVTFWLAPNRPASSKAMLVDELTTKATLESLRPRDIVLLRTVGLSSFRNRVYGQSLRNGLSKVDILHREGLDESDICAIYSPTVMQTSTMDENSKLNNPQLEKALRVKEWLLQFVDIKIYGAARDTNGTLQGAPRIPPDSQ